MQDQQKDFALFGRALIIGVVGGIFGSVFSIIMYYFNFSEVAPHSYLFVPMVKVITSKTWVSYLVTIVVASICSVILAAIYYGLFRKIHSMWIGLLYGLALWVVIFIFLQPVYQNVQKIQEWNTSTMVSTVSLFVLYGIFIGYSISHDYFDTLKQVD